jgi:murein L,D-transpeptidase YcbB/YkuD
MKLSQKIGAALVFCSAAALAPCSTLAQPVPAAIHTLAVQASESATTPSGPYDERGWLARFYAPRKYAPAWTPSTAAAALWVLRQAALQGLDPRDYGAEALQRQLHAGSTDAARFDVALTSAMLHYLADLRVGRVRSEYHTHLPDPRLRQYDPVERLRTGLATGKLQAAVQAAEPQIRLYGQVKAALAHYRELSRQPYPALPKPGSKLASGGAYPAAKALFERLVLLGDLPADAPPPAEGIYSEGMEEGVRHFQSRHGLLDDGVLGRGTIDALNVPPARRVRQLELTLERLRWLPDVGPGPMIMVDLPVYRLWALNNDAGSAEAPLEMRVVVGTAVKTETPLFVGQMRYLEFNPYWNVPRNDAGTPRPCRSPRGSNSSMWRNPTWLGKKRSTRPGSCCRLLLIVLMLVETKLAVMLNDQAGEMTSALAARNGGRFWTSVRACLFVLAFAVPIYAFYYYMRDLFANQWRRWLTNRSSTAT